MWGLRSASIPSPPDAITESRFETTYRGSNNFRRPVSVLLRYAKDMPTHWCLMPSQEHDHEVDSRDDQWNQAYSSILGSHTRLFSIAWGGGGQGGVGSEEVREYRGKVIRCVRGI